ncbi:polysaccharide export protein [Pseudomonas granadensis]|uniref:Polysaccharide export protein n=1 Tax=Pseudomonas granadensis TaxID=1421430 RepID=A0ABX7G9B1_9PSED|nr:polysaccharide biosynthesis/export family protein [Pseudomonas granadensis]MBN6774197.1 polysaccharide export protein [Pseudomonas granadensis]MBN6805329.1 polysaccharide export protein [Pseudomonas granadensis]MBN6832223.1 polysaccharide export protein [Pseudomonas granadensis]MBN6839523.1 polysaccharide export protein [Pseudomonas granadensis]MBN6868646.1 polysaccharide export protein [Pseudomonas granadensis]
MNTSALVLSFTLVMAAPVYAADPATQYKLAAGDVLRIIVFGEPELSLKKIRLSDAGTFSYPFLGEISAKGLTPGQVEKIIVDGLKQGYLVDPKVSLSQIEYRSFYINGEVKKPGSYPFVPGLTLEKAIALGGGLTERASIKRVTILRGDSGATDTDNVTRSTTIAPGDTISIAQGFF